LVSWAARPSRVPSSRTGQPGHPADCARPFYYERWVSARRSEYRGDIATFGCAVPSTATCSETVYDAQVATPSRNRVPLR
jgi:hypothetical protein